jgi:hypothetical protein
MAKKGLRSWVKENWVDIANKKSDGSYPKCGRSSGEKRKNYPKCVPIAKARGMSKGQKRSAVARKQKASNTGPKPSNVRTLAKNGGYMGSFIKLDIDGKTIGNPSLKKYYKGMV